MRVLLAIAVTVAQVAGPWLCCCGPARMFLTAAPIVSVASTVQPRVHAGGCPHCVETGETPGPTEAPVSPVPEPCPCGGLAIDAVPPAPIDRETTLTPDVSPTPSPFALAPWVACPSVTVSDRPGLSQLPFTPTAVRLFTHHALRC